MDAYSNFINHFVQAKTTIRQATNARPQFVKYIEQCTKEHKEKLTLSDLLIMPVQRIPRYCLILKVRGVRDMHECEKWKREDIVSVLSRRGLCKKFTQLQYVKCVRGENSMICKLG